MCIDAGHFAVQDLGQKLENIYPPNAISEEEASAVAFHSFPDSLSQELHNRQSSIRDTLFIFRIKRGSQSRAAVEPTLTHSSSSHYEQHKSAFLYGYVFCRQRQDDSLRRGADQHSLVLLSEHPYSSVLVPLCQWAGPFYFNHGQIALEELYMDVLAWDPPSSAYRGTVTIGGVRHQSQVPDSSTLPPSSARPQEAWLSRADLLELASGRHDALQGAFYEVDVYTPLKAVLEHAWQMWEAQILAQPLLIVAPTAKALQRAGECSNAVAAMVALISPLPYSADFRPYFTIHDPAFAALAAGEVPSNANGHPRLLGITNLYFLKALPTWPNVLSVGTRPSTGGSARAPEGRLHQLGRAMRRAHTSAGPSSLLSEFSPRLWSTHQPLTRPDKALLDRLLPSSEGDPHAKVLRLAGANSAALKRHFCALTCAFLAVLEPFCTPLGSSGPAAQAGPLQAFSHAEFLAELDRLAFPPSLQERFSSKAACQKFCRRFLESPNFASWLERRRRAAWDQHLTTASQAPMQATQSADVELVEEMAALENQLDTLPPAQQIPEVVQPILQQLRAVIARMPQDLQQTMLSSPARAKLLQITP